jgi:hypothetical protein
MSGDDGAVGCCDEAQGHVCGVRTKDTSDASEGGVGDSGGGHGGRGHDDVASSIEHEFI